MKKKSINGEVLMTLGTSLFVGGAACYATNKMTDEEVMAIAVLSLILIAIGADMKKRD